MNELFHVDTRPPNMPDWQWEGVGLMCLAQLSDYVEQMVDVRDEIDFQIGQTYAELFIKQAVDWVVVDRKYKGKTISREEAQKLVFGLVETLLEVRKVAAGRS